MGKMKNPDIRFPGMFPAMRPGLYQDFGIVLVLMLLSVACLVVVEAFLLRCLCVSLELF